MLVTAIALCVLAPPAAASEYFPLEPGTKWSYESSGDIAGAYDQEVGTAVEVGGESRAPIIVIERGKIAGQTFYQVTDSAVLVLGNDPKKLLKKPQPVFQIGLKEVKWDFVGDSPYEDDKGATIHIIGQSKPVGMRTVLGTKRECLEVKTENRIGMSDATATVYKQVSTYAKGVGLVEMQETIQFGKKLGKRTIKLTKFEAPGAGSR